MLTRGRARESLPGGVGLQAVRGLVLAVGVITLVDAFVRFVVEGLGTPAPVAPTEQLVVGGLYRHVRNPMYVAVVAIVVGQALLLGQPVLLGYAATVGFAMAVFVHAYEEPALARQFGEQYERYRRAVPRWWPTCRRHSLSACRSSTPARCSTVRRSLGGPVGSSIQRT